ncbi:MAG: hypothetical protein ACPGJS_10460 [Flammeovirgaceae bacterium]
MEEIHLVDNQQSVTISFPLIHAGQVEITLYPMNIEKSVQVVQDIMLDEVKKLKLDVSSLCKGVYFYIVKVNRMQTKFGRIVVS